MPKSNMAGRMTRRPQTTNEGEGAAKPAPSFPDSRVLVSPRNTYRFFLDKWVTERADDGTPVRTRKPYLVELKGFKVVGSVASGEQLPAERREYIGTFHIDATLAARFGIPSGPRVYEGCSVVVDENLALSCGYENDEDSPVVADGMWPEGKPMFKALEKFYRDLEKHHGYGLKMAFVDDHEAFAKLIPQFEKNRETAMQNERDAHDYIALEAMEQA